MAEIGWCIRKNDGPCLVVPNANLAGGYLIKAEDAIGSARTEKVLEWKKQNGREKDLRDIETIEKFLRMQE